MEEREKNKRKSNDEADLSKTKRMMEEEFNYERDERRYKQLMHLLNKSKFYANYLLDKVDKSVKKEKAKKSRVRVDNDNNDENVPPAKRIGNRSNVDGYNIQKYLPEDVSNVQVCFLVAW